jgi:hypothetical protein
MATLPGAATPHQGCVVKNILCHKTGRNREISCLWMGAQ